MSLFLQQPQAMNTCALLFDPISAFCSSTLDIKSGMSAYNNVVQQRTTSLHINVCNTIYDKDVKGFNIMPFKYYVTMYSAIRKISCGVRLDNNCILSSFFIIKNILWPWEVCFVLYFYSIQLYHLYIKIVNRISQICFLLFSSNIVYLKSLHNEEIKCIQGVANKVLIND